MPTYDYFCKKCSESIEISHKISDEPHTTCPSCKQATLQRGIGGGSATFRFMGEGFYITDYKKECSKSDPSGCCPCKEQ